MFFVGHVSGPVKNFKFGIYSDAINMIKCQSLHDGTTHWALPVQTTFSDLDHSTTGLQAVSLALKFMIFSYSLSTLQTQEKFNTDHPLLTQSQDKLHEIVKTRRILYLSGSLNMLVFGEMRLLEQLLTRNLQTISCPFQNWNLWQPNACIKFGKKNAMKPW